MAAAALSPTFRTATASVNGVYGAGLLSLAESSVTTRSGPLTGVGGGSGVGLVGVELPFPHAASPSVRLPMRLRMAIRGRLTKPVTFRLMKNPTAIVLVRAWIMIVRGTSLVVAHHMAQGGASSEVSNGHLTAERPPGTSNAPIADLSSLPRSLHAPH